MNQIEIDAHPFSLDPKSYKALYSGERLFRHSYSTQLLEEWNACKKQVGSSLSSRIEVVLVRSLRQLITRDPEHFSERLASVKALPQRQITHPQIKQLIKKVEQALEEGLESAEGAARSKMLADKLPPGKHWKKVLAARKVSATTRRVNHDYVDALTQCQAMISKKYEGKTRAFMQHVVATTPFLTPVLRKKLEELGLFTWNDPTIECEFTPLERCRLRFECMAEMRKVFLQKLNLHKQSLLVIGAGPVGLFHLAIGSLLGYSVQGIESRGEAAGARENLITIMETDPLSKDSQFILGWFGMKDYLLAHHLGHQETPNIFVCGIGGMEKGLKELLAILNQKSVISYGTIVEDVRPAATKPLFKTSGGGFYSGNIVIIADGSRAKTGRLLGAMQSVLSTELQGYSAIFKGAVALPQEKEPPVASQAWQAFLQNPGLDYFGVTFKNPPQSNLEEAVVALYQKMKKNAGASSINPVLSLKSLTPVISTIRKGSVDWSLWGDSLILCRGDADVTPCPSVGAGLSYHISEMQQAFHLFRYVPHQDLAWEAIESAYNDSHIDHGNRLLHHCFLSRSQFAPHSELLEYFLELALGEGILTGDERDQILLAHYDRYLKKMGLAQPGILPSFTAINEKLEEEKREFPWISVLQKVLNEIEGVACELPAEEKSVEVPPQLLQDPHALLEKLGVGGMPAACIRYLQQVALFRARKGQGALKPPKGVILAGPPGTGKTAIARQMGLILGVSADHIQLVNAAELHIGFIGDSEKAIKDLFEPARKNQQALHLLIFDEVDALLSTRRERPEDSNHYASVVAAFLAQLDGLQQIDNVLVVGLTNRVEAIDPAAIRPGRLYPTIRIEMPDRSGRLAIWRIHLDKIRDVLGEVDIEALADETEGATGAEIEQCVQGAYMDVLLKNALGGEALQVTMQDLRKGLTGSEPATKRQRR